MPSCIRLSLRFKDTVVKFLDRFISLLRSLGLISHRLRRRVMPDSDLASREIGNIFQLDPGSCKLVLSLTGDPG